MRNSVLTAFPPVSSRPSLLAVAIVLLTASPTVRVSNSVFDSLLETDLDIELNRIIAGDS